MKSGEGKGKMVIYMERAWIGIQARREKGVLKNE